MASYTAAGVFTSASLSAVTAAEFQYPKVSLCGHYRFFERLLPLYLIRADADQIIHIKLEFFQM